MYILSIFIFLFLILYLLTKKNEKIIFESFYPAWNDHVIYGTLSKRVRVGIWKGWININNLQFINKLIHLTNSEVRLFNNNNELLNSLYFEKSIDIAVATEVDYGLFVFNKLSEELKNVNKENKLELKKIIDEKINAKRIYTLYPIYRIFITNNFKISKPEDIDNKVIQITNISNQLYKLDLDLLNNFKYKEVYREKDRAIDKYGSLSDLKNKIDGYFSEYDNPNETLQLISENTNTTFIDLYDEKNENNSLFPKPKQLLDKYFFLKKDKMDLSAYPTIVKRRKQTFDFYNLSYNPEYLNCYSYKVILLTRSDVNDEMIYLFSKAIFENFDFLRENIVYFNSFNKQDMLKSSMSSILNIHQATFTEK